MNPKRLLGDSPSPQKSYKGKDESHKRLIFRTHLFSGRIFDLCKIYQATGKPIPVFQKQGKLLDYRFDFFGRPCILKFSNQDEFSSDYIRRLHAIQVEYKHQFLFSGGLDLGFGALGAVFKSLFSVWGLGQFSTSLFKGWLSSLGVNMLNVIQAAAILIKTEETFTATAALTMICTNLGLVASNLTSLVWPMATGLFVFQAQEKPYSWVPSAVGLLLALILGANSTFNWLGLFSKTAPLGYSLATIVGATRIISDSITHLLPWVYKQITGCDWDIPALAQNLPQYLTFIDEVEEFEQKYAPELDSKWEYQERCRVLQQKYHDLVKEATRLGLHRTLTPIVASYNAKIQHWMKRVTNSGLLLAGHRMEPLAIMIQGKAGIGKSYIINQFVKDVGQGTIEWTTEPHVMEGETITNHIYFRNPAEDYWSGYKGQYCVVYDDFAQMTESESKQDPSFMELIQAVGDNPFKIPMADLDDKNRAYFRSKMIICTTNMNALNSTTVKSIRHPEALGRRFDLIVEMRKTQGQEPTFDLLCENVSVGRINYQTLVNMARAKINRKLEKFQNRQLSGQERNSNVPPVCLAPFHHILSVPANVGGTGITRPSKPTIPDHSFCPPDALCQTTFVNQSFKDWANWAKSKIFLTPEDPEYPSPQPPPFITEKISLLYFFYEPYLCDKFYLLPDPAAAAIKEKYEKFIEIAEIEPELVTPLPTPAVTLRKTTMKRVLEIAPELFEPFEIQLHANSLTKEELLPRFKDARHQMYKDGIAFQSLTRDIIIKIFYDKAASIFSRIKGVFRTIWNELDRLVEKSLLARLLVIQATSFFVYFTIPGLMKMITDGLTAAKDYLKNLVSPQQDKSEVDEKLLVAALKKKKREEDYDDYSTSDDERSDESKDKSGRQKKSKGRAARLRREVLSESKPDKGRQRRSKGKPARVSKEDNSCKLPDDEDFPHLKVKLGSFGVNCLAIGVWEGEEYVTYHPGISYMIHAPSAGTRGYESVIRLAALQLADLMILATLDHGYSGEALSRRMVAFYTEVAEKYGNECVVKALNGSKSEEKFFGESQRPSEFKRWLESQDFKIKFQGTVDENCDNISKKVTMNLCDIGIQSDVYSRAFFYEGRKAWVNKHTYEALRETGSDYFTLTFYKKDNPPQSINFKWAEVLVGVHPEVDLVVVQFPTTMMPMPSLKSHIMKDSDLNFETLSAVRLVTRRKQEILWLQTPNAMVIGEEFMGDGDMVPARTAIRYRHMNTIAGDCGSPLLAIDATRPRKICGLHFLGSNLGTGFSVLVTQEVLEDLEELANMRQELAYQCNFANPGASSPLVSESLGVVPTPFEPTKTKVRQSLIHGDVTKPTTRPSILREFETPDGRVIDPMKRGVQGFQQPRANLPLSFEESAMNVMTRYISGPVTVARTLTIQEACTGGEIEGLEPIELSTSAGLPYCLKPDAMGKRRWINDDHTPKQELIEIVDQFLHQLRTGNITEEFIPIFKDTMKDERLPHRKADKDKPDGIKTRLFSACPLHLLVTLRQYYGAFFAHLIQNAIHNTTTSGVNPFGPHWHMIAMWLHEVSPLVDDGDYSSFDSTQPPIFLNTVYKSIRHWYNLNGGTPEDDLIRERLSEFCTYAFHSARGYVYRSYGSLPSGMFGTTAINSGVNLLCFWYAFSQIYPEATSQDFLDNVRTVTHGDDVMFSVSKAYANFTSEAIGVQLRKIGMTFTPATKGDTHTVARPIEECTFLKRGFKKMQGFYRAPLATESSLEMVNWITKCPDPQKATTDNCMAALNELAISEANTEYQQKICTALYEATEGNVLLHPVTPAEALINLRKHF